LKPRAKTERRRIWMVMYRRYFPAKVGRRRRNKINNPSRKIRGFII
jgi:hypothetical protein